MSTRSANARYFLAVVALQHDQFLLEALKGDVLQAEHLEQHAQVIGDLLEDLSLMRVEKRPPGETQFHQQLEKCLFALYLDVYTFYSPASRIGGYPNPAAQAIRSCLETFLPERYPEINKVKMNKELKRTTVANRILWYAGQQYPEFVSKTDYFIEHAQEQKGTAEERKKYFTNAGKMLVRLGPDGYARSQLLFTSLENASRVKRKEIEAFYEKSQKAMSRVVG